MRIGILSYHFPPEPAFVPGSLAEELVARGHEVRVLTGFPDYPGGHVYPGWRQRWRHQTHSERLTVRRVPRYAGGDGTPRARERPDAPRLHRHHRTGANRLDQPSATHRPVCA
ncbi:glycosyltransferase family 4 protein, partial [Micromonospora chalcea]